MALPDYNLTYSCIDNLKEVTDNSSNKVDCVSKQLFRVKNEVGIGTSQREYNLKEETEAANFHFEPTENKYDENGMCVTFKKELEGGGHYSTESCLNAQEAIGGSSINADFASEYYLQVKKEVGFDDDTREYNLKQETVNGDIKQLKKESDAYNIMQIYIKSDTKDEMQACDGQFNNIFINNGETHNNYFQTHSERDDSELETVWFQCHSCEFKSKYASSLKNHIEYKHNNKRRKDSPEIYQCQFCEFKSRYKHDLNRHTYYKHNENPKLYQCTSCDYETKHRSSLVSHTNCKHNESAKWYQCSFCDYKTKYKSSLVYHFKMQHDESSEVHHCPYCEYKSKDKNILQKHINCKHSEGAEMYQCQFCEGKYRNKRDFKRHIDYMHNENVEWHRCDHCDYKTKYRQDLRNHVKTRHDKSCKGNHC